MSVIEFPSRHIVNPSVHNSSEEQSRPTGTLNSCGQFLKKKYHAFLNDSFRSSASPHDLELSREVEDTGLDTVYGVFKRISKNTYQKASPEPLNRNTEHSIGSLVSDGHVFRWEIVFRAREDGKRVRQLKIDLV